MSQRVSRTEWWLVLSLLLLGFGLRAAVPSRMAVEHFDEGVYASNLYAPDFRYPFQHLYAPPLLPFSLEWTAVFGGPQAVMWVNVLAGSLTLLVVWRMVRNWWGPIPALMSLLLLALSEFQIAYSRAALTDAMLCLWMSAGVWIGSRAILQGGALNLFAAGLLAGLAWWTKYNGWLTLAITGAGTGGWVLFARPPVATAVASPRTKPKSADRSVASTDSADLGLPTSRLGYLVRWAITAVIAFAVWSPWLMSLQEVGGYAAVAKNHSGYFTGPGQWLTNAWTQLLMQFHLGGFRTFTLLVMAMCLMAVTRPWWVSRFGSLSTSTPHRSLTGLAGWMTAAWVCGLVVAVPLYTPYPRLAMPLFVGVVIALGGLEVLRQSYPANGRPLSSLRRTTALTLLVLLPVALILIPKWHPWEDRTSFRSQAGTILESIGSRPLRSTADGPDCIVAVLGEPGLFFHLASSNQSPSLTRMVIPLGDVSAIRSGTDRSTFVVTGPSTDMTEVNKLVESGHLEPVDAGEMPDETSSLVRLDRGLDAIHQQGPDPTRQTRVFHVKQ